MRRWRSSNCSTVPNLRKKQKRKKRRLLSFLGLLQKKKAGLLRPFLSVISDPQSGAVCNEPRCVQVIRIYAETVICRMTGRAYRAACFHGYYVVWHVVAERFSLIPSPHRRARAVSYQPRCVQALLRGFHHKYLNDSGSAVTNYFPFLLSRQFIIRNSS